MDALKIEKATLAGCDWGARTANIIAVLWPERCKAMVSVSGYLIGSQEIAKCRCRQRLSPNGGTNIILLRNAAKPATKNIVTILRSSFGRSLRRSGSSMCTFERTAASFNNPYYVSIVIHNYRWRLGAGPEGDRVR